MMPIRKVNMEERRKHHHFLSFRHSSSPTIGMPEGAVVSTDSWPKPPFIVYPRAGLPSFILGVEYYLSGESTTS